jgi:hypothetical protein
MIRFKQLCTILACFDVNETTSRMLRNPGITATATAAVVVITVTITFK